MRTRSEVRAIYCYSIHLHAHLPMRQQQGWAGPIVMHFKASYHGMERSIGPPTPYTYSSFIKSTDLNMELVPPALLLLGRLSTRFWTASVGIIVWSSRIVLVRLDTDVEHSSYPKGVLWG